MLPPPRSLVCGVALGILPWFWACGCDEARVSRIDSRQTIHRETIRHEIKQLASPLAPGPAARSTCELPLSALSPSAIEPSQTTQSTLRPTQAAIRQQRASIAALKQRHPGLPSGNWPKADRDELRRRWAGLRQLKPRIHGAIAPRPASATLLPMRLSDEPSYAARKQALLADEDFDDSDRRELAALKRSLMTPRGDRGGAR